MRPAPERGIGRLADSRCKLQNAALTAPYAWATPVWGSLFNPHYSWGCMTSFPAIGHSLTLHDEVLRIPFIVKLHGAPVLSPEEQEQLRGLGYAEIQS